MGKLIQSETQAGSSVEKNGYTIIPYSQSVRLMFPGQSGGLIWNRPVSLLVRSPWGQEQVLPVPDVTRQAQWALLGASLVWIIFLGLLLGKKR